MIKKIAIYLFFFILITGCETTSERTSRISANDNEICQNQLKLKPGSEAYANCRINIMQLRMQEYDRAQRESEFLINYGAYISRCGITGRYC